MCKKLHRQSSVFIKIIRRKMAHRSNCTCRKKYSMSPSFISYLRPQLFWQYAKLLKGPMSGCFKHHRELNVKLVHECFTLYKRERCRALTLMWLFPSLSQSLSVLGFTGTTTWWTVSGTESSPFRSTQVGKCMIFSDSFFTSKECKVAEHTIT